MTNKKLISIVLGVMCFALTVAICIQVRSVQNSTTVSQSYEESNLRAEVLRYQERYENILKDIEDLNDEINKQIDEATQENSDLEDAQSQIKEGNMIIGTTDVSGPGVIITLDDSTTDPTTVFNPNDLLLHDLDILSVVNELKNTGAEAISINDQRLVTTTSIQCGGAIININGQRVGAPFEIKAIGLPENLSNLERPGGYLDDLREKYQMQVKLEKSNNITIPRYSGVITFEHAKTVE